MFCTWDSRWEWMDRNTNWKPPNRVREAEGKVSFSATQCCGSAIDGSRPQPGIQYSALNKLFLEPGRRTLSIAVAQQVPGFSPAVGGLERTVIFELKQYAPAAPRFTVAYAAGVFFETAIRTSRLEPNSQIAAGIGTNAASEKFAPVNTPSSGTLIQSS